MSVDKTYRCAARYCPGLPYAASDQAHPLTCTEPPTDLKAKLRADADRILPWAVESPTILAGDSRLTDDVRRFIATHPIPAAARPWVQAAVDEAARLATKHEGDPLPPIETLSACVGLGLSAAGPDEPPWCAGPGGIAVRRTYPPLYPDGAPTREQGGEWVDAAKMKGTRYAGTSGQAEWPPKGDGERRFWPVGQLSGTGPITDADAEAAEACVAGLPAALKPWVQDGSVEAGATERAYMAAIVDLTAERDDLRETIDQIAEHVGAKTRGARPAFARWLRDEVRLFVANLTRERDTAIDAFHRCRIERDQACTSGDAAAFVWADERAALIGERDKARAEVARLTAELNAAHDDHTRPE